MPAPHPTVASGYGAGQIQGARAEQQDALGRGEAVLADGRRAALAILADGMGGHAGGALAAQVAVAAFAERCASGQDRSFSEALQAALEVANRAIAQATARDPHLRDMGCTLLAAAIDKANLHFISVGDSILWLVRDGALTRLNADHSMAPLIEAALARGEITEAEAQVQRSGLRSALTGRTIPLIDARSVELRADDALLLASDGILTLSSEQITEVITAVGDSDPPALIAQLLAVVEHHAPSDQDNCSLIWVAANSAPAAAPSRRRVISPAGWTLLGGLALAAIGAGQLLQSGVVDPRAIVAGLRGEGEPSGPSSSGQIGDKAAAKAPHGLRQGEKYPASKPRPRPAAGTPAKPLAASSASAPAAKSRTPAAAAATAAAAPASTRSGSGAAASDPAAQPGAASGTDATRPDPPDSAARPLLVPDPAIIDEPVPPAKPGQW